MDELPRDAKDLLALARMADEPPAAARDRVRNAVALTLSVGVATSAAHAAATEGAGHAALKAGFLSTLHGKLALVSSVALVIGVGAMLLSPTGASPHAAVAASAPRAAVTAAPVVGPATETPSAEVPVSAPATEGATPRSSSLERPTIAPVRKVRAAKATALDESLRAEMTMLHEASTALDRGEIEQARVLLSAHRAKYRDGQLREERQGLEVLVRCMGNDAASQNSARAYLRSAPQGVLSARIASACIKRGKQ